MLDFTPLAHTRPILLPYMATIVGAFRFSLMVNAQNHNYYRTNIDNGTLYSGIGDIAYARARELFADVPEVEVKEHGGQSYISVADQIALRFKHFDRNFRPRNARTEHNKQWTSGVMMPGFGAEGRPDFGYRMDPLGIDVQDAFVAMRLHDNLVWLWQVFGDEIDPPFAQLTLLPGPMPEPNFAYDYFGA